MSYIPLRRSASLATDKFGVGYNNEENAQSELHVMSPVQHAHIGVDTCTSKVDLIRSVVSFEGVAATAGTCSILTAGVDEMWMYWLWYQLF
jgi:hypothetical protein